MFRLSTGPTSFNCSLYWVVSQLSLWNYCLICLVPGHQHLQHNLQQHHHLQHQHPQHLQRHPQHPQHPPQPPQQQHLLTKFETSLEGGYGFSIAKSNSFSSARSSGLGTSATTTTTSISSRGRTRECECPMCYHSAANPCSVCGCPSRDIKTRNESQGEPRSDQVAAISS